jgi:hypothetical protein
MGRSEALDVILVGALHWVWTKRVALARADLQLQKRNASSHSED